MIPDTRFSFAGLAALAVVASACAHGTTVERSTEIAATGSSAAVCDVDRARADRYANAAAAEGSARRSAIVPSVLYDMARVDRNAAASLIAQANTAVRQSGRGGFHFNVVSPDAARCREARKREREAMEPILVPPITWNPPAREGGQRP